MSYQTFLLGTSGRTIYSCRLSASGQVQLLGETSSGNGSTWLYPHGELLYAVNEHDDKIEIFTIDDRLLGKLTSKNIVPARGGSPCYLDIDPTGKWLAVTNYGQFDSSNFALLPLNAIGMPSDHGAQVITIDGRGASSIFTQLLLKLRIPNSNRQQDSHVHQALFYQGYLYVTDFGTDTLSTYRLDDATGQVHLVGDRFRTHAGAGPRHLVFHPNKPFVFVCNELDSTTSAYRVDTTLGKFEHQQTITTRRQEDAQGPNKMNQPAEIQLSPDGKLLLVSNRRDKNIVVYTFNSDNDQPLSIKEHLDCRGSCTCHFTFDPTGTFLLLVNVKSDNLICFSYDSDKGTFEFVSQLDNIQKPEHIVFL